jgi:hypothetical protein
MIMPCAGKFFGAGLNRAAAQLLVDAAEAGAASGDSEISMIIFGYLVRAAILAGPQKSRRCKGNDPRPLWILRILLQTPRRIQPGVAKKPQQKVRLCCFCNISVHHLTGLALYHRLW